MICLTIEFNGANFLGWQIQKDFQPTVQESLNNALKKVYKEDVSTLGSGRTDAGVHAKELFVTFKPPFEIDFDSIPRALNTHLPNTIRVKDAKFVNENFRPTNDAISREYRYFFSNEKNPCVFLLDQISNISYHLDEKKMQEACDAFIGKHDFLSFHCLGSDPKSTTREIFECSLYKEAEALGGIIPSVYCFRIVGNGFLKQMVRSIMGTIWSVGRGKVQIHQVLEELKKPTGKHLAAIAPPNGLYKFSTKYPLSFFDK